MTLYDARQVSTDVKPGQVWYWRTMPYRVLAITEFNVVVSHGDVADIRNHPYRRTVRHSEFFEWFTSRPSKGNASCD